MLKTDVARFTSHVQNFSGNKKVCCKFQKCVAKSGSSFYLLQQNLQVLYVLSVGGKTPHIAFQLVPRAAVLPGRLPITKRHLTNVISSQRSDIYIFPTDNRRMFASLAYTCTLLSKSATKTKLRILKCFAKYTSSENMRPIAEYSFRDVVLKLGNFTKNVWLRIIVFAISCFAIV